MKNKVTTTYKETQGLAKVLLENATIAIPAYLATKYGLLTLSRDQMIAVALVIVSFGFTLFWNRRRFTNR